MSNLKINENVKIITVGDEIANLADRYKVRLPTLGKGAYRIEKLKSNEFDIEYHKGEKQGNSDPQEDHVMLRVGYFNAEGNVEITNTR